MNKLLKLIDICRTVGVVEGKYSDTVARQLREDEWSIFEKCQPFVFVPIDERLVSKNTDDFHKEIEDAPFPIFSIEIANNSALAVGRSSENANYSLLFSCIVAIETSPQTFNTFSLIKMGSDPFIVVFNMHGALSVLKRHLEIMSRSKFGLETARTTTKIGNGKEKRMHRIKKIIHVAPAKFVSSDPLSHRHVNWTHRFEVRGHWRKVDRLGKDRQGQYCIEGFTWVMNHVRGPEDMPVIKKTRLVDATEISPNSSNP